VGQGINDKTVRKREVFVIDPSGPASASRKNWEKRKHKKYSQTLGGGMGITKRKEKGKRKSFGFYAERCSLSLYIRQRGGGTFVRRARLKEASKTQNKTRSKGNISLTAGRVREDDVREEVRYLKNLRRP